MDSVHLRNAPLLYKSTAFRRVVERALDEGADSRPLLIMGESGSGKSKLARFIGANGVRRKEPVQEWIAAGSQIIDPAPELCGVAKQKPGLPLQAGLLTSCDRGTAVINQLDLLSPAGQEVILEYLTTGRVRPLGSREWSTPDVRLIFTINVDLLPLVRRGKLNRELTERLLENILELPPLRERPEDAMPLLTYLVREFERQNGRTPPRIAKDAVERIMKCEWQGNAWSVCRLAALISGWRDSDVVDGRYLKRLEQINYGTDW